MGGPAEIVRGSVDGLDLLVLDDWGPQQLNAEQRRDREERPRAPAGRPRRRADAHCRISSYTFVIEMTPIRPGTGEGAPFDRATRFGTMGTMLKAKAGRGAPRPAPPAALGRVAGARL